MAGVMSFSKKQKYPAYLLTSLSSRAAKKAQVLQHYDEEYLWRKDYGLSLKVGQDAKDCDQVIHFIL